MCGNTLLVTDNYFSRGTDISKAVTRNNVFYNYAVNIMLKYEVHEHVCSYVMLARRVLNEVLNATAYLNSHLDILNQVV